jgi:hypothetical protein
MPAARILAVALLLTMAGAAPAWAGPAPITGRVPPGYTVIALADDGGAVSAIAGLDGEFSVVPPASVVTLQLRSSAGVYGGPVVVADRGRDKVVVGVRAGAQLGPIRVADGFGRVLRRLSGEAYEHGRFAYAKKRKPRGAGRNGRVRRWPSLGVAGQGPGNERQRARRRGADPDRDGIPDAFDVDDDGDLRLDNVDARASLRGALSEDPFQPSSLLNIGLDQSYFADDIGLAPGVAGYALNENAARSGDRERYARLRNLALRERGLLLFPLPLGPAELDCGGLVYCRSGGSGMDITRALPFPGAFDPDGDGFGSMTDVRPFSPDRDGFGTTEHINRPIFGFAPRIGLRQQNGEGLGTGDAFVERFANGRAQPAALGYVFDSVPAIRSWDDGTGRHAIQYPVPRLAPGTDMHAQRIRTDRPLTLEVWRPQRRAIPGEAGCPVAAAACDEPVDIGGLTYIVAGKTSEQNRRTWHCPASAYSAPAAERERVRLDARGVVDLAEDAPTARENTITFSVDLRRCRFDGGGEWPGFPSISVYVAAVSRFGDAAEGGGLVVLSS